MKSLNKKISAIVLAGMVVMGGVVSSGVSSFAASANKVSVQEYQYKQVEFYSKQFGKIIEVDKNQNNLEKKYDKKQCYNNGHSVRIKKAAEIAKYLYIAQYSRQKFVKINFDGYYYLIEVK